MATCRDWPRSSGGIQFRYSYALKQANDYDADGDYVRHWLPELKNVPAKYVHAPWNLSAAQQEEYKVKIGVDIAGTMLAKLQRDLLAVGV